MEHGLQLLDDDCSNRGEAFTRLESTNALEPGQYWRLTKAVQVEHPYSKSYGDISLREGDLHLVTKLFEFEGTLHSITFLEHPRSARDDGRFDTHTLLTADFLDAFEPVPLDEAKAIRAAEQEEVMRAVQAVQQEMQQAQVNPLALPAVQEAAKVAVEKFEQDEAARVQAEIQNKEQRAVDLRRIHRRAARRSEAKGNPLAVRKATISDRLDVMISEGVTSDGVRDLQLEAGRRLAIATATSSWLAERSKKMGEILKRVTPFFAEQGQLALASASTAIERVSQIERGITSLKLYTGDGVDVIPVREGADAPTDEPLTIMQRKLAMDEELAVWVDVEESFDCSSKELFFRHLADDERLLQQILPTPRCVVSMQVTRRNVAYSEKMSPFERVARDIENKQVFLLVRNGQNVSTVYSSEPSHEAAIRLFPTEAEIHEPFRGLDGSSIGLQDVAFGKATGNFEDQALHYRRFLILLCGLDHRLNLFGEFFPPEEKPAFMSQSFQQRYFRFVEDDDSDRLLGEEREGVYSWMRRHNAQLRSGSRVVVTSKASLRAAVPHVKRSHDVQIDDSVATSPLIAAGKAGALYLPVPTIKNATKSGAATAWVTGPDARRSESFEGWHLCIDRVKSVEVQRYIHNRSDRIGRISWILTLRRALRILQADEAAQADLRAFLHKSALDARVQDEDSVDEAIDQAIATWRADHRGAAAPALSDKTGVTQLLSLIFPAQELSRSMAPMIDDLCAREGLEPLMLTRTGKNQYALYSVFPEAERAQYSHGVGWGWVRRHLLKIGRSKASLGSQSTTWLQSKMLDATEEIVTRWPALDAWVHEKPEPCKLNILAKAKEAIAEGQRTLETIALARDGGAGLDPLVYQAWLGQARDLGKHLSYSQTPYLWIPLGLYQQAKDDAPLLVYAVASLLEVASFGTQQQRDQLAAIRGFASRDTKQKLSEMKSPEWSIRTCKELHIDAIELGGQLRSTDIPAWSVISTHKPGGLSRSGRRDRWMGKGSTRAERREQGGSPRHESTSAVLSIGRAIDTLMGKNPQPQRAFYCSVEKRVRDHWFVGATGAERDSIKAKRQHERSRRFEPQVPHAFELAPCLWDPVRGRSLANRWLGKGVPARDISADSAEQRNA